MSGIFGTRAPLASDLNLILQLIILAILLVGVRFGKKKTAKSLKAHGRVMTLAVALNAVGILLVMLPSFVIIVSKVLNPLTIGFPLTSIHAFFGVLAEGLGVTLVFKKFGNVRRWMRLTTAFWLITIALGISVYLIYYVI
jgi:uncharacterized membrane protein YozB (DUF420 family)